MADSERSRLGEELALRVLMKMRCPDVRRYQGTAEVDGRKTADLIAGPVFSDDENRFYIDVITPSGDHFGAAFSRYGAMSPEDRLRIVLYGPLDKKLHRYSTVRESILTGIVLAYPEPALGQHRQVATEHMGALADLLLATKESRDAARTIWQEGGLFAAPVPMPLTLAWILLVSALDGVTRAAFFVNHAITWDAHPNREHPVVQWARGAAFAPP